MVLTNFSLHEITDPKQRDELNGKLAIDDEFVPTLANVWVADFEADGVRYQDDDGACTEESTVVPSCENEWSIPQHAHRGAGRTQQTASQEPRTACGNSPESQIDLEG